MKCQASVEFLILLGVLTLIFAVLINYSGGYLFYSDNLKIENQYKDICSQVKDEIENALEMGPFYNRTFYLPTGNYNVSISNYEIKIIYNSGETTCFIPVNLSTNLNNGKNTIIYNETGLFIT
jgi:hypothetical protein